MFVCFFFSFGNDIYYIHFCYNNTWEEHLQYDLVLTESSVKSVEKIIRGDEMSRIFGGKNKEIKKSVILSGLGTRM